MRKVLINGCFDKLHDGHRAFVKYAGGIGDLLVVAVNDDESVHKLKGDGHPIDSVEDRIAELYMMFDQPMPIALMWQIRRFDGDVSKLVAEVQPDTIVRGWDQTVEPELADKIVVAPRFGTESTTSNVLLDKFVKDFEPLYGKDDLRWQSFKFIAEQLLSLGRPVVIIETGSMRRPGSWNSDGCATMVWDWIARETRGIAVSIDIEPSASDTVRRACPHTRAITMDSIPALRGFLPSPIDLLYLDSYDYSPGLAIESIFHQIGELGAAWSKLPEGCLIASDDCQADNSGKHVGTKIILNAMGMQPVCSGYISVWKKVSPVVG